MIAAIRGLRPPARRRGWRRAAPFAALFLAMLGGSAAGFPSGQNPVTGPPRPHTIPPPESNHPSDADDVMLLNEKQLSEKNFTAINLLRQQQIDVDAEKLLILSKDLNTQLKSLGDQPMTPRMQREAQVIELLARDVQKKMTITVNAN